MKLLFSAHPAYGHLLPLLPTARAAAGAGHDVLIATGPDMAPRMAARGFRTCAVGPTFADMWAARSEVANLDSVPPEQRLELAFSAMLGSTSAKRAVDLVPVAEEWAPDVVIHEPSEFAGPVAAHLAGAPHITHGFSLNPPVPMRSMLERAMTEVFAPWNLPGLVTDVLDGPYLDYCPRGLRLPGDVVFEGDHPLRPSAGDVLPTERLPASLDTMPYARTVYLTLGTVFHGAPDVFERCLDALREMEVNVVVTVGPDGDPAAFGPQPANVVIENFIPQALLLSRCSLVITHGGAGTMLGALASGVPLLLLPQGAEQFLNGAAVDAAGAGLWLPPDGVTTDAVRAAVSRLLDEPGFYRAAGGLRDQIDDMPSPRDVVDTTIADIAGRAA